MQPFHIYLHGMPTAIVLGERRELDGVSIEPVQLAPAQAATPLPVSFDEAYEQLARLERLFLEPDGSFTWVSPAGSAAPFQFDGLLHDGGPRLAYLELKGAGPLEPFDAILTACGWPEAPLLFQLVRAGVFLDETNFRRWARLRPIGTYGK